MDTLRALCLLAAACLALPAHGDPADPEAVLKLEPYRKTVALRATVGGQEGLFPFDTAGGLSLLTPGFAAKVGCKPWGRITGFQMMGARLDMPQCGKTRVTIGGHDFEAPIVGVYDIMQAFPKDAQPVEGLLALDLFADKAITIDFPAKRLIVESPESLRVRTAKAAEFPLAVSREVQGRALAVSIGVPTAQGPVWMELDSGNGGTILVSKPYAALFGLDATKEGPQSANFALGNGLRVTGPAFTPDMIIDGNIGMPFLQNVAVTLDLPARRLWISR